MDELYDWAKEEQADQADRTRPLANGLAPYDTHRLPAPPPIRLMMHPGECQQPYPYHGPGCWCQQCDGPPPMVNSPAQRAPLLDQVIALVVAFAAMIVGGLVIIPLIVPLVGLLVVLVVAVALLVAVVGLVILGITRAITGRPVREMAQPRRWR